MKDEHEKWAWLKQRLVEFTAWGSVLIFVTRKVNSEEVATSLRGEGQQGGCGLCSHGSKMLTFDLVLGYSGSSPWRHESRGQGLCDWVLQEEGVPHISGH